MTLSSGEVEAMRAAQERHMHDTAAVYRWIPAADAFNNPTSLYEMVFGDVPCGLRLFGARERQGSNAVPDADGEVRWPSAAIELLPTDRIEVSSLFGTPHRAGFRWEIIGPSTGNYTGRVYAVKKVIDA